MGMFHMVFLGAIFIFVVAMAATLAGMIFSGVMLAKTAYHKRQGEEMEERSKAQNSFAKAKASVLPFQKQQSSQAAVETPQEEVVSNRRAPSSAQLLEWLEGSGVTDNKGNLVVPKSELDRLTKNVNRAAAQAAKRNSKK